MKYEYWLFRLRGVGSRKKIKLVTILGSAKEVYESSALKLQAITITEEDRNGQMSYRPLLSAINIEEIEYAKLNIMLNEYEEIKEKGISFTSIERSDYPKRLVNIPDPPYGIMYIGTLPSNTHKAVAMVGARMCSEYGKYIAKEFASNLAKHGIQIISGMAKGVDGISQQYALESKGYSCGVLGCSVDICYPNEHRKLYDRLKLEGCILSEFPLKTPPKAQHFPMRNRIISGLADGVLVIEAKEKSGTLITVDQALEQGRDVYAVPGKIVDSLSYGCNYLIKQGATIILSPEDLYRELSCGVSLIGFKEEDSSVGRVYNVIEEKILELVDGVPVTMDMIYEKMNQIEFAQLQYELMQLVLSGDIKQVKGNYFQKNYS